MGNMKGLVYYENIESFILSASRTASCRADKS